MKNEIKIRIAKQEDFEAFYKLFKKTLKGNYFLYSLNSVNFLLDVSVTRDFLKQELQNGNKTLYLAHSGRSIAGYLLTNKVHGGVGFGHWLGVDKKFQKHGAASSLLSYWEKDVLGKGAHILQLWTTENNLDFYKNRGFTLGGNFPDSWFGVDHFLFYKTLRKSSEKNFLKEYLKKERGVK